MNTVKEVTYTGRRMSNTGKVIYAALLEGTEHGYSKRPFGLPAYAQPGQVWAITFSDSGDKYYVSGPDAPRMRRVHEDVAKRAAWLLEDKTAQAEVDRRKAANADTPDPLVEMCRPLARLYRQTGPVQRAALLIRIVAEVQAGML